MVSIEDVEDQRKCALLKDLCLRRLLSEDLTVLKVSLDALLIVVEGNPAWRSHLDAAPQRKLVSFTRIVEVVFFDLMIERRS